MHGYIDLQLLLQFKNLCPLCKWLYSYDASTFSNIACPTPSTAPAPYAAPPPAGYPTKETPQYPQNPAMETKSKGDGFWKGW